MVKGKAAGSIPLPGVSETRGTLATGTACASHAWNGPEDPRPRCEGDAARLTCR
ncbi:MAG TPA: hypothetical protein VNO26_17085 [Candidatus Limnocylindria bacterium]|nr:hypothetical protein [Candidatus Limnocylindria bacterium]